MRRTITTSFVVASLVFASLAVSSLAAAVGPASSPTIAVGSAAPAADPNPPKVVLDAGVAHRFDDLEVVVDGGLVGPSPDRPGLVEVRASVAVRNLGEDSLPTGRLGLPAGLDVRFRDARGDVRGLDVLHPSRAVLPGGAPTSLPPGMWARWTVGGQVPEVVADEIDVLVGDAAWHLEEAAPTGFQPPAALPRAVLGSALEWSPGVTVTPRAFGSLRCGDAAIEPIAHVVAIAFDVSVDAPVEQPWPGREPPATAATAWWADGSAAVTVLDAPSGPLRRDGIRVHGAGGTLLPSGSWQRVLVGSAWRDGRFLDVAAEPAGVLLAPPGSGPIWLDLSSEDPSVVVDSSFCDLGSLGAPIPHAFSPGPRFVVAGEGPFVDDDAADLAALGTLRRALAAAARWFDVAAGFDGVTTEDLERLDSGVAWVERSGDPTAALDIVLYAAAPDEVSNRFAILTESASGRWFCARFDAPGAVLTGDGATATEADGVCLETETGS